MPFYILRRDNEKLRLLLRNHWCNARGVMVSVAGYGHGDTSSNPGPDWLHFT